MADYRLLYADLLSSTVLGELPATDVSATETLNAAGRLSATVPLLPPSPGLYTTQEIAVAKTRLYFERNGVIIWGGILWGADADLSAQTLSLTAEGFHSLFKRKRRLTVWPNPRPLPGVPVAAVEQITLVYQLVTAAQYGTGGDLGVLTGSGSGTTGVTRVLDIPPYDKATTFGNAIDDLADAGNGFDYRYISARDPSTGDIEVTFQAYYPKEGLHTQHVFEVGTNCAVLNYSEDGTVIVNSMYLLGVGQGVDRLWDAGDNLALIEAGYPVLSEEADYPEITDYNELRQKRLLRLSRGAGPMRRIRLQTFPDAEPPLGSYAVGNQVRVIASMGWVDVDDTFRIVEMTIDAADGGESITLDLVGLESFIAV